MPDVNVLFVDADLATATTVGRGLEAVGGFRVRHASTASDAFIAAQVFRPDFALIELVLHDVEGLEVGRRLLADPATSHTSIAYLTSLASRAEVAARGGLVDDRPLLAKPITLLDVLACIEKTRVA